MMFHVVCQWQMIGEYDDEDDIRTKVYRCEICGRTTERKSVFGRVAKELEEKRKADGFDLPEEKPLGKPTAEDVLRSVLTSAPEGIPPEEWTRAVKEFQEGGVELVENPDGTLALRAKEGCE